MKKTTIKSRPEGKRRGAKYAEDTRVAATRADTTTAGLDSHAADTRHVRRAPDIIITIVIIPVMAPRSILIAATRREKATPHPPDRIAGFIPCLNTHTTSLTLPKDDATRD